MYGFWVLGWIHFVLSASMRSDACPMLLNGNRLVSGTNLSPNRSLIDALLGLEHDDVEDSHVCVLYQRTPDSRTCRVLYRKDT